MKMDSGERRAAESLYAVVEATGSRLARTFGWVSRFLGAALGGIAEVQPTAVVRIRSRRDDAIVYEEEYRFALSGAIAAKERFEEELRTLTEQQFKERYGLS